MKYSIRFICLILLASVSCKSEQITETEEPQLPPITDMQESYRDKVRTQPYPKETNELMLNPAPFIVPQAMKTGEALEFAISDNKDFNTPQTIISKPQPWCFYNLHSTLAKGTWYWRFRSTSADGSRQGEWSEPISFTVTGDEESFVTPSFENFKQNITQEFPRLYCFLNPQIDEARRNISKHTEYRALTSRAGEALKIDYNTINDFCVQASTLRNNAFWLYQAAYLTQEKQYSDKMHDILKAFARTTIPDGSLFTDNFVSSNLALCHVLAYDLLHDSLTPDELSYTEEFMMRILRQYYKQNLGYQENHIFDNHFWQQNMRVYFQIAFLLANHHTYQTEVLPMLEYYYELWTARAPAGGFNRDGMWHNGTGYFGANVHTLAYMPMLLSYISRFDFMQHPWYRAAGQALVYSFPPHSASNGFGDASENGSEPSRLTAAFADFLARETNSGYAGWYASECSSLIRQDYELRLYRMCADRTYSTALPTNAPKMKWYKDIGEVAMHSTPGDSEYDLVLSFRSSTFGSGSHTTASQNAFNLLYKGKPVYRSSGYYQNFSDAHNLMSYRHSRAHNTILVNGCGQPYSTSGYGNIVRAMGGENISYCLGDASKAYSGITDDPIWLVAFEKAGICQTPEFGFGTTPLTKYRRHILMLHPDIVLIYDELEASEAVRWDWLLHSNTSFNIDEQQQTLSTAATDGSYVAVTQIFSGEELTMSQTDQFVVPPAQITPDTPNQWHFSATIDKSEAARVLAVVRVGETGSNIPLLRRINEKKFEVGNWTIHVELNASQPACLEISNKSLKSVFSYGTENPVIEGNEYSRQYLTSSILYDEINDDWNTEEQIDYAPISTRNIAY